jgi:glucosamine--fructose-6-phosphate aminotransferase (isomerizing)
MCGIIGYVGDRQVTNVLIKGLKRLEYRGYDSSGIAVFSDGRINVTKAAGKIADMEKLVRDFEVKGTQGGIGHTRWATHGAPNGINAHPHRVGDIVIVHNGIIENFREIQELVISKGFKPQSETDSELFAFLIQFEMDRNTDFVEAVRKSFLKVRGASSVVALHEKHPGLIVGVRNGSPLVVACDEKLAGSALASDVQALLDYTNRVAYLENGDMVVCRNDKIEFIDTTTGRLIDRSFTNIDWNADRLDKNGYPHYMLKEIHEQARTILDTLNSTFDGASGTMPFELQETQSLKNLQKADRLTVVACGTSWHASLMGKYWLEEWSDLSVESELASEYRYRNFKPKKDQMFMGVSQSGETADTLAVLQMVKDFGSKTMAICNVKGSSIPRVVDDTLFTMAGPEIGVASTKAFTGQMLMLLILAARLYRDKAMSDSTGKTMDHVYRIYKQLYELPLTLSAELESDSKTHKAVMAAAEATQFSKGFFFIGRGYSFPLALEGALKLKEIAYVHAEGYAAGELKHGPIAMLEPSFTVIVIAPKDRWYEKTISNLQEVKARGATIIALGNEDDERLPNMADHFIPLPIMDGREECLMPFIIAPALQLFSYKVAVLKGTDVDQPRNLAKSVTVE